MRGLMAFAVAMSVAVFWPAAAGASGGYSCGGSWSLESADKDCASTVVIAPGNDTRVNLLLLMRESAVPEGDGPQREKGWEFQEYGSTFFEWQMLADALFSESPRPEYPQFYGTRCQSVERGGEVFMEAVTRNGRVGPIDRLKLAEGRVALVSQCAADLSSRELDRLTVQRDYISPAAEEFGTYIIGASAFYASDWRTAAAKFTSLKKAKDAWVREAAHYMVARTALAVANDSALNEWGYFDAEKTDLRAASLARAALADYLEAYPSGRFANSAKGLLRRATWLGGEASRQGQHYARLLESVDPQSVAARQLLEEIDDKFLLRSDVGKAMHGPLLLATHDLMRMRKSADGGDAYDTYSHYGSKLLSAEELNAQAAAFAGRPDLYSFLRANHAYYVAKDYRRVLQLVPDDARRTSYTPLQFSRQALRGMALAKLGDRNEAGFWQELLGGADKTYQRSAAELGLALAWERAGQVEKAFAANSPIRDARIRERLLEYSAGPQLLRQVADKTARSEAERDLATYVLLYRELSHGQYAAALGDMGLVRMGAPTEYYDEKTYVPMTPVGLFTGGKFSENYACPALRETIGRLSRNPRDVQGRLCLAEFYRLNGFDDHYLDYEQAKGSLGSHASYPGKPVPRSAIYDAIIAEPGVPRDAKAYALYRAIHCYAPSKYSTCGGEQVPEAKRGAWFRRLKGEFGDTRWAKEAKYYW